MFTHCYLGTNDIDASRAFYGAVLGTLGYEALALPHGTLFRSDEGALIVARPANGEATTPSNGFTLGFKAKSYDEVNAFHAAALAHGGTCEGTPGVRPNSPGAQYGAYVRDTDGNKICAYAPNAG
ncbi:VOC family protein [Novosphingobium umbonatum]|uniref:VOC family protein n=1 Tax=Novosphingobium umbonatum TaxID=1908524 RepID=A0A437N2H8_9SPHN|nr:VOC family protein [Novosphingobium umbonatum]RVU04113.1 VOC family protein [Novosphingobium umbonatum]